MNVVCIGSGYVGTVTAAAWAALGHPTTVIDVDEQKVHAIQSRQSPIYEPGLNRLIQMFAGDRLDASTTYNSLASADVVFICVGTPSDKAGMADLSYVRQAAVAIGQFLDKNRFTVIVNKSTVPVGTTDLVARIIEKHSNAKAGGQFAVVSNPEFLREGHALEDVFFPDRIIIGTDNRQASSVMKELYMKIMSRTDYNLLSSFFSFFYDSGKQLPVYLETDTRSAELIKYVSNAFLAVKISYINEVARLCEALGGNVTDVAKGMGLDRRIGEQFLKVSSGWGGSCLPKDTSELLLTSQRYESELYIVKAAIESNRFMHEFIVGKIRRKLKSLNGKTIGILGLTFKPGTNDVRQSQASYIIRKLIESGAYINAHDPQGIKSFSQTYPELPVKYCVTPEEAADQADLLLLLTHWHEYLSLDWELIKQRMRSPFVMDTRNVLPADALTSTGFRYEGIGTGS